MKIEITINVSNQFGRVLPTHVNDLTEEILSLIRSDKSIQEAISLKMEEKETPVNGDLTVYYNSGHNEDIYNIDYQITAK